MKGKPVQNATNKPPIDWQLYKEEPPQWYNQTKEFTDAKGGSLELLHELEDGNVGTFLYHGPKRTLDRSSSVTVAALRQRSATWSRKP